MVEYIVSLSLLLGSASSQAKGCINVIGELALWNSHPPFLRVTLSGSSKVYGVLQAGEEPASDAIPITLYSEVMEGSYRVNGKFCIEKLGSFTKIPYSNNDIEYVKIKRFSAIN
ncbi:hypothetical protein [Pseudoalteromonas sp. Of7M-16]|uniref:hypothetical protein n=1 Tax=Pseudoalteromonas sp. Of7M-16 TaxID=2917756 RepID=UPI001EF6D911|nr:hypothetical protein [Pseudoalteromonas sp. Of7M-16]MCG7551193.1 hypothetical protein [Pseudoalteromonas sp. Of7M-16]